MTFLITIRLIALQLFFRSEDTQQLFNPPGYFLIPGVKNELLSLK